MSSTHRESMGEGFSVTVQHCEYKDCDKYLGVNYPSDFCDEHRDERSDESQAIRVMLNFSGKGPVHQMQQEGVNLTWCGAKSQYRHVIRPGIASEVTCSKCRGRLRLGRPLAWGATS